ncbi:hypothetical protein SLG_30800 [Sphingobium sp. SYK-6]|uniref:FxDxF family PEP-CTERM protein n=1 Tax=Sphingobium sp. (strain NBRC 103272 / SYK-6) TaxID=627192 RepID=UPI00022774A9|nr:FxDxF family PEP-CTERM protein [Sphingobium sp. SYK-6]BAK67755.1 hypothetical protein SLG_30800 [Sphingobium sp. SYK-6]
MKKQLIAASAALSALFAAPAVNAAVVDPIDLTGKTTDSFSGVIASAGAFTDVFSFTLDKASAMTSSSITSILTALGGAGDIDFTQVTFNNSIFFDVETNFAGTTDVAHISGVYLSAGSHQLTVSGFAYAPASYGGNINILPVPEPATWGLMLVGLSALGWAMRRRKPQTQISFG